MAGRDEDVHKALAHPLRAQILAVTGTRVVSPVELAGELDEPLGVVSYHVRVLAELGLLVGAGTSPRRGALQHHYRAADDAPIVLRIVVRADDPQDVADRLLAAARQAERKAARGQVTMTVLVHASSEADDS
jgi:DNA-binding transcriptional ArsR family regulator